MLPAETHRPNPASFASSSATAAVTASSSTLQSVAPSIPSYATTEEGDGGHGATLSALASASSQPALSTKPPFKLRFIITRDDEDEDEDDDGDDDGVYDSSGKGKGKPKATKKQTPLAGKSTATNTATITGKRGSGGTSSHGILKTTSSSLPPLPPISSSSSSASSSSSSSSSSLRAVAASQTLCEVARLMCACRFAGSLVATLITPSSLTPSTSSSSSPSSSTSSSSSSSPSSSLESFLASLLYDMDNIDASSSPNDRGPLVPLPNDPSIMPVLPPSSPCSRPPEVLVLRQVLRAICQRDIAEVLRSIHSYPFTG